MAYTEIFKANVKKIYKKDEATVVFELLKPASRFHSSFLVRYSACYIMPKHIWEKVEDPLAYDFYPPVSIGPYTLKDIDPTGFWFLWERREDWENTALGKLYGKPQPKYVLFNYVGPPEKKVMAQARHELDVIFSLTPEAWNALKKKNPYSRSWYKDFPEAYLQDPATPGVTINNDKYPLNMADVRWALALSLDIVDAFMLTYNGAVRMTALHNTPTQQYLKWYYQPMESWLKEFSLDLGSGKFRPYDPETPFKLADRIKEKGIKLPEDREEIKKIFGYGWWKHSPEAAEKLLIKNGFKKNDRGRWLLPDGTPWKLNLLCQGQTDPLTTRLAHNLAGQWRKFGIDIRIEANALLWVIANSGKYDLAMTWPVETWGGHPDLFRYLEYWHSEYYAPVGEPANDRNPTRMEGPQIG